MSGASALQAHQGAANRAEQRGCFRAPSGAAPVVEPVGQPLQHHAPIAHVQGADQVVQYDGHGLGQPVGRQFGRGARRRLRGEG